MAYPDDLTHELHLVEFDGVWWALGTFLRFEMNGWAADTRRELMRRPWRGYRAEAA